jgi:hypothetical protein
MNFRFYKGGVAEPTGVVSLSKYGLRPTVCSTHNDFSVTDISYSVESKDDKR